jgi:hypothetical protein
MKSRTILKLIERALNPDLKDAHLKAYAKAMIEEDRKRILQKYYDGTNTSDFNTMVKNTPIILD